MNQTWWMLEDKVPHEWRVLRKILRRAFCRKQRKGGLLIKLDILFSVQGGCMSLFCKLLHFARTVSYSPISNTAKYIP